MFRLQYLFFTVTILMLSNACRKEVSRPFKVINNSGYDIVDMSFRGAMSGDHVAVNNTDTSSTVFLAYTKRVRLTPKLLTVEVNEVLPLTSLISEVNDYLPFSKKDLSSTMNYLTITSEESADRLTFIVKLNE